MPSLFFNSKKRVTNPQAPLPERNDTIYINPRLIASNPIAVRSYFDEGELVSLANSIRTHGMLVPLCVRVCEGGKYELINGERRLRAARILALEKVPCVIRAASDSASALSYLTENIERNELHYFEIADCLFKLIKKYSYTKCELAALLSLTQSEVLNSLKLLEYSDSERKTLIERGVSRRKALALLRLKPERRSECVEYITKRRLNSFQTELYIDNLFSIEAENRFHRFDDSANYAEIIESVTVNEKSPHIKNKFIIKDLRLFYNSVENSVRLLQDAGINIKYVKDEDDEKITLCIDILKKSDPARPKNSD